MTLGPVATVHPDLRSGFRQALMEIEGLPPHAHWAWEGRLYRPVVGRAYVREAFRPAISRPRGAGRGGVIEHRIVGNADLVFPTGKGTGPIEDAAGLILAAMCPGRSIYYGEHVSTILTAERGGMGEQPDWLQIPVTMTLMAHTAK